MNSLESYLHTLTVDTYEGEEINHALIIVYYLIKWTIRYMRKGKVNYFEVSQDTVMWRMKD